MNTNLMLTRMSKFRCQSLSALALASCLLPNALQAGTCDLTIADLLTWLKQNPANNVTATLAANRPPALMILPVGTPPTGSSEVTYSKMDLRPSGGYFLGGLYNPTLAKLYYDDRLWGFPPPPTPPGQLFQNQTDAIYPFDPQHTDKFQLLITSTGTVYVYPANASQVFTATCSGGVMYGQPAGQPFPPMYMITFAKSVTPPVVIPR